MYRRLKTVLAVGTVASVGIFGYYQIENYNKLKLAFAQRKENIKESTAIAVQKARNLKEKAQDKMEAIQDDLHNKKILFQEKKELVIEKKQELIERKQEFIESKQELIIEKRYQLKDASQLIQKKKEYILQRFNGSKMKEQDAEESQK